MRNNFVYIYFIFRRTDFKSFLDIDKNTQFLLCTIFIMWENNKTVRLNKIAF